MVPPAVSDTCCTICGVRLHGQRDCLACLVRGGLAQPNDQTAPTASSLVFGDFEIERRADGTFCELGHGAMGITYRARDRVLHRDVALKVIEVPAETGSPQTARERFLREARAAAGLRHPNVAAVFQFGAASGDRCYYAMELVEGETLEALIRREGPLAAGPALEIAIQVTRALVAAAARGLIHRDLKPANIMLVPNDSGVAGLEVKVIDFGLAKVIAEAGDEMDLTHGAFVGTPTFASPEQFAGKPADARSDIYSLGVTLWSALTGEVPYPGRTIEEIRDSQAEVALPVEQLVARKVPVPVTKLLRRTLATDPSERPQSAWALLGELESCWTNMKATPRRRRFRRAAVVLCLFILGVAGLTSYLLRRDQIGAVPPLEKSIAVLPFQNLSKDEANAFFASGVQDEILSDLARIADLKVISRTSVMKYGSAPQRNVREIAKRLGVSHLVEGSVQREGDRIRVTAQLIDARADRHLWAEHYDRALTDVFAIQSEIARQIAGQLRSHLSPAERTAIAERPTADLMAYQLYSEARAISVWDDWRGAEKSMARKVELLEQATQRDPSFALAWCALAKTGCDLSEFSDPAHHLELAKKAADAALRLRPDLGEVHRELARYYLHAEDFSNAYEELTVALRTLPNDSETFRIAAETNRHRNRWDEAVANFEKARELDPGNGEVSHHLGRLYQELRRYDDWERLIMQESANEPEGDPWAEMALAEIQLDKGDPVTAQAHLARVPLDFSPTDEIWHTRLRAALYLRDYDAASRMIAAASAKLPRKDWFNGLVARFRGDQAKAQAVFTAAREKFDAAWGDRARGHRYFSQVAVFDAALGRKQEAIEEARRAVDLMPIAKDSMRGPLLVRNLAMVCAWTGERDLALEQLEIVAKIPGGPTYGELRFDPTWDFLRGDPRFEKIIPDLKPNPGTSNRPAR